METKAKWVDSFCQNSSTIRLCFWTNEKNVQQETRTAQESDQYYGIQAIWIAPVYKGSPKSKCNLGQHFYNGWSKW